MQRQTSGCRSYSQTFPRNSAIAFYRNSFKTKFLNCVFKDMPPGSFSRCSGVRWREDFDASGTPMVQLTLHPSKKTGLPQSAFPSPLQCAYAAVATYKGDADLEDRISEADLAKTIGEGVVIRRAVVVLVATTGDYIVYLRLSDRAGYVCLAKRKPTTGPKAWGDFRTLHRTLHKQGFFGGICVFSEGHPVLHRLGISAELPV